MRVEDAATAVVASTVGGVADDGLLGSGWEVGAEFGVDYVVGFVDAALGFGLMTAGGESDGGGGGE